MNVILWMWILAPCFLAFVCAGLVFGLAEILRMRKVLLRMRLATEQLLSMLRAGLIQQWFPVRPQCRQENTR
ncbi:hypothetical protein JQ942_003876 [Salmonella enterica]|uniref:Uncharacterized protein n=1 Tax=Salmonella enterica TaxID=28901 RepID=A0A627ETS1_SALER|nr:hypothetical protein [Salmonella enterica]EDU2594910.1 hypothetical protein [Salmonella enterica subsp. enterica serovar Sandiego]EAM1801895.1 hypothetical protein [Salmonella enterica]EAN1731434.1 hypothetical protein [Salmonella enterica]EAO1127811.1 hypothetical protein [Salmonella enterica]EAT7466422.1 hypothetical protein [Salmonella enterica]